MSIEVWKQRCLVAVAEKRLPVLPGDYVLFSVSGSRLLVTTAMPCYPIDNEARGYPTMGQDLGGLIYHRREGSSLTQIVLDWSGFEEFWTIERIVV